MPCLRVPLLSTCCHQDRNREAEDLYARALTIFNRMFGPKDFNTMNTIVALAGVIHDQGRIEEAESYYR